MAKKNAVYAQSGGVTSVINASAYGVIKAAQEADFIDEIYGGFDGINGVLDEKLIDLGREPAENIEALRYTPAGAMGSARKKLRDLEKDKADGLTRRGRRSLPLAATNAVQGIVLLVDFDTRKPRSHPPRFATTATRWDTPGTATTVPFVTISTTCPMET